MKITHTRLESLLLAAICIGALFLRLPLLNGSFWLDEAAQALESVRPLNQQLSIAEDFQPPLLHLITHEAAHISHAEWWLRFIGAVIPGIISVGLTYTIGRQFFSKKTAFFAALLLTTSSFHVFYSQELRPYSLSTAWALLSWQLLIYISKNKVATWREWAWFMAATTLGMYSTYLYPFVVFSQLIFVLLLEKKMLKAFLLSCTGTALLFAPWLPKMLEQLQVGKTLQQSLPGWSQVVAIPQLKSLPLTIGKFIFGVLTIDINLGFIAITGAVVLLSGVRLINWPRFSPASKKAFYTLAIWFLFPLLLAWITSFFIPILQPKRVLYTLPALYLILSALIFEYPAAAHKQLLQKISAIALPLLVLFIQCYSLISYYSKPMLQRENWRAVQQKIAQEYPRDSIVLFGFDAPFAPWIWYADSQYPTLATGNLVTPSNSAVEATIKKVSDYRYVLVFDYLLDLTDPERKIDFALQNLGFSEKEVFSFPNIGFIRVYSRKGAVLS